MIAQGPGWPNTRHLEVITRDQNSGFQRLRGISMELGDQRLLLLLGELNLPPSQDIHYTCPCFDMTPLTLNKSNW